MARKRPPFYSKPHNLIDDLLDRGMDARHIALLDELWCESSRGMTDGILAPSRAKSRRTWDEDVARELVISGNLRSSEQAIELVDFLEVNNTREQIAELTEKRAKGGRERWAKAESDPVRQPDGTFAPATCPVHGDAWTPSKFPGAPPYCPRRARPGEPSDNRGHCSLTATNAAAYLAGSRASARLNGASARSDGASAPPVTQRNVTSSLRDDGRTEPDDSANAPSPVSDPASDEEWETEAYRQALASGDWSTYCYGCRQSIPDEAVTLWHEPANNWFAHDDPACRAKTTAALDLPLKPVHRVVGLPS
jgi:hypothetical protein